MEGDGFFTFRKQKVPGRCPVLRCRCPSRPSGEGRRVPAHRLCQRHAKVLQRARNPIGTLFVEKRSNARTRGVPWSLTLEQFTEIVMQQVYIDGRGRERHCLHIDRIEPSLGYVVGNIQIVTAAENVIKGNQERRNKYVEHLRRVDDHDGEGDCPF